MEGFKHIKLIISPVIHKIKPHPDCNAEKQVNETCARIIEAIIKDVPLIDSNKKFEWNVIGRAKKA